MLAAERLNVIMEILRENKSAMVSDLSKILKVSEETVRRDLTKLEDNGRIRRVHGGAFLLEGFEKGAPVDLRRKFFIKEKRNLAKACLPFIRERDIVMLDGSTTSLFIAKAIKENLLKVTVITNFLDIMVELSDYDRVQLVGLGGIFSKSSGSFNGHNTTNILEKYCADKVFVSCSAVSLENGATDHNESEARIRELMFRNSNQKFLVVDHTKLNKTTTNLVLDLHEIDYFITDKPLDKSWETTLGNRGINIIISD